eukprot:919175-Prymnesium_polylepis.1
MSSHPADKTTPAISAGSAYTDVGAASIVGRGAERATGGLSPAQSQQPEPRVTPCLVSRPQAGPGVGRKVR